MRCHHHVTDWHAAAALESRYATYGLGKRSLVSVLGGFPAELLQHVVVTVHDEAEPVASFAKEARGRGMDQPGVARDHRHRGVVAVLLRVKGELPEADVAVRWPV